MGRKQEYSQIGLTKKRSSQTTDDKLCSLVPPTTFKSLGSQSFTDAPVITIDEYDEKETLEQKKKPKFVSWWDGFNKLNSVVKGLPKSKDDAPVIIIDDDDEKETLEPKKKKKKKPKFVSWWDGFNKLNSVVKGLPKSKDAAPIVDSCVSSTTNLHVTKTKEDERSLSSVHHGNVIDLCKNESYSDGNSKENQDRVGYGHVSLEDFGVSMVDPWLGGGSYIKDFISPLDSCFSYSSFNDLLKTETNTKKDDERSHHYNFIDLTEDVIVGEGSTSSSTGKRHVSIEELGVSVEDLKSMPWEAFDPTWEIRSEIMDPWLGGYIKDIFSAH